MSRTKGTARPIQQMLDLLEGVRRCGGGWTALCPAHNDTNPSLSVTEANGGKVLVKCHAGCETTEILDALGLQMRDLFPKPPVVETRSPNTNGALNKEVAATYDYCDETGRLLYQNVRYRPKGFRPRRPGNDGGWIYNLEGRRRVLYNLPEVVTATHIIVTEGEKDADRTSKAVEGFEEYRKPRAWAVTTCCGGASGWRSDYASYFSGKSVYILPDNDDAGRKFSRTVARAISPYARRVKIVALPGLPEKGDVSDYLDAHDSTELQDELDEALLYERADSYVAGGDRNSFNLQSLRDCFDAPEEEQQWLVEGILPAGGMSVISAKPKVGKSTVARQLALAIATGESFLGRETQQGEVIYLALEEKKQEVTNHFRDLGATGDEPIRIHCGSAPLAAMEEARLLLQQHRPALLIIDPLFKFTRVKDGNDYAQMTAALEPILALARETGTHILCVHHSGKGERADPTDAILGSTAIFGNVDTALMLAKYDGYRTISSCQRYGEDLPETVLEFNPDRRAVTLGASREQAEQNKREQQILKFLELHPGATEADILAGVVGRRKNKVSDLRNLVGTRIKRQGKGGKTDPYGYSVISCSPDSDNIAGTRTQNGSQAVVSEGKIVVPKQAGTSGNKNRTGTGSGRSKPKSSRWPQLIADSCSLEPQRNPGTRIRNELETPEKRGKILVPKTNPSSGNNGNKNRAGGRKPKPSRGPNIVDLCSQHSDGTAGTRTPSTREPAASEVKVVVPKQAGTSGNKNPIGNQSRDAGSRAALSAGEAKRRCPDADMPWSPFEEQIAILEVEDGISRAEAVRRLRANMSKRAW